MLWRRSVGHVALAPGYAHTARLLASTVRHLFEATIAQLSTTTSTRSDV